MAESAGEIVERAQGGGEKAVIIISENMATELKFVLQRLLIREEAIYPKPDQTPTASMGNQITQETNTHTNIVN